MDKEQVLAFLREHPDFLVEHAGSLGIGLHDKKIRSFAQVQIVSCQLKTRKIAEKLQTILDDVAANRKNMLHQLALNIALLRVNTIGQVVQVLYQSLHQDFGLTQFVLKVVAEPKNKARIPIDVAVDGKNRDKICTQITMLTKPVLGHKISKEMQSLLPENETAAESFLQLPIPIGDKTGALLLLADTDVYRFSEGLETELIEFMAEALGAVLSRIMGYR